MLPPTEYNVCVNGGMKERGPQMARFRGNKSMLAAAVALVSVLVLAMGLFVVSFAAEDDEQDVRGEDVCMVGSAEPFMIPAQEDVFGDMAGTLRKTARGAVKKSITEAAGEDPAELLKRRQEAARCDAVNWAITIAEDNSFHYGESKWAHHNGCYFCGTNQKKGSIKRKAGAGVEESAKTYCCNPFVTAAFVHGAGATELDCRVESKRIGLSRDKNRVLKNTAAFEKVDIPDDASELEVGDILLTPTHAMIYAGDGFVVEAAHHDNGVQDAYWDDSIRCAPLKARQWNRTELVYRYIGTGAY